MEMIFSFSRAFFSAKMAGLNLSLNPTATAFSWVLAKSAISRISCKFIAKGFSISATFTRGKKAFASAKCELVGLEMMIMSKFAFKNSAKSVKKGSLNSAFFFKS